MSLTAGGRVLARDRGQDRFGTAILERMHQAADHFVQNFIVEVLWPDGAASTRLNKSGDGGRHGHMSAAKPRAVIKGQLVKKDAEPVRQKASKNGRKERRGSWTGPEKPGLCGRRAPRKKMFRAGLTTGAEGARAEGTIIP